MEPDRYRVFVTGIVQGVGFRPFVHALAKGLDLFGWVNNTGDGVHIEVEGSEDKLQLFVSRLRSEAPSLASIRDIVIEKLTYIGYSEFVIQASSISDRANTSISPDASICNDCTREIFTPGEQRYRYPFTNCTNCGPRFTIIKDIPYDRLNTTMSGFKMCEHCLGQYENPADRRYHAQPIACPICGPKLALLDKNGKTLDCSNPVDTATRLLTEGFILAIKGIGGYHLACDAYNRSTVDKLRKRKHRDEKPFALMASSLDSIKKHCIVNESEVSLLESVAKPIVLLKTRTDCKLPAEIAPGNPYLGFMLPYTPLHMLLFEKHEEKKQLEILVMTSGNRSAEPIFYKDSEAVEGLAYIADYFLTNDRDIYIRTDDSVVRSFEGKKFIIRRARGYAPSPLYYNIIQGKDNIPSVLACGGELKNTFCMNKDHEFYMSHHIGDLENLETILSYEEGVEHFKRLFGIKPQIIAHDLHPDYLSTKYAKALDISSKIGVQHHKAHIASCMADNNIDGDVIGVAFDGTGYGEDGKIWGGEFFTGSLKSLRRAGHLQYIAMPGGDAAVKEPWRMAASYLYSVGINFQLLNDSLMMGDIDRIGKNIGQVRLEAVAKMLGSGFNSPLTSSMGRLFDAVSALAGIRNFTSFEGQGAMELEYAADSSCDGAYHFTVNEVDGKYIPDFSCTIAEIVSDRRQNISKGAISSKFHETIALLIEYVCSRLRKDTGYDRVVLSGGVFQNTLLLKKSLRKLTDSGFVVYIHKHIPTNDGGISLGQAVIAMAEHK